MIEWNDDQKQLIKTLDQFLSDTSSEEAFDYPFVVNGAAGCLVGSTMIPFPDDSKTYSLEYMFNHKQDFIGRKVFSYDNETNSITNGIIEEVHNTGVHKIAKVHVVPIENDGKPYETVYQCTYDHKFLVENANSKTIEFIQAKDLCKHDSLVSLGKPIFVSEVELTNDYENVYDLTISKYHNYGLITDDGEIIITHNTGKTFTLTEHLNKTSLKYLFLCYTGKAANVCARHGIPSETIHHCLFLPTGLSTWQKFSQKIKYGLIDCKGTVTENPNWNGKDPNSQYVLNYTGDREVFYYIRKNSKGEDVEEIVDSEVDIPKDMKFYLDLKKMLNNKF